MEYEFINAWINSGMNEDIIKEALKEATYNGVSNLRYIDKIIYEWKKKGYKTVEQVRNNKFKKEEEFKKLVEAPSLEEFMKLAAETRYAHHYQFEDGRTLERLYKDTLKQLTLASQPAI